MNSLIPPVASVVSGNWNSVIAFNRDAQKAITKLSSFYFGPTGSPTFAQLTLTGLTTNRLIYADGSNELTSVANLSSWIAGTANEINVADDGDGTITIGIVDPLIVSKGGTGVATLIDHGILLGSGTDAITSLGVATNGQLPIGSTGADPVLATLTGTTNQITVTNGAGTITLSTPQDIDTSCDFQANTVDINQATDDAAVPVLTLTQADVSEDFIKFIGSTNAGDVDQSLVNASDVGTATIAGYIKVYIRDDGDEITDQSYYMPVYSLIAAPAGGGVGQPMGLLLAITYSS
jgi:hypothetical protein